MSKYSKWIGLASAMLLIGVCFMPWTYHADVQKAFTGFFSEKGMYGKPGKFLILLSALSIIFILTPRLWAKRIHLFTSGLMVAYAIKTYILYTSCYNAYCPDKKFGIYLVLLLPLLQFVMALFPDMVIKNEPTHTK